MGKRVHLTVLIVFIGILIFSFQNCGQYQQSQLPKQSSDINHKIDESPSVDCALHDYLKVVPGLQVTLHFTNSLPEHLSLNLDPGGFYTECAEVQKMGLYVYRLDHNILRVYYPLILANEDDSHRDLEQFNLTLNMVGNCADEGNTTESLISLEDHPVEWPVANLKTACGSTPADAQVDVYIDM